ncbi:MAG: TolC family protein [Bacteroidales bacterium]|nr:TolC family protein [Bacteroidales bacterium]
MKRKLSLVIAVVCCGGMSAQQTYSLEQILDSARQNNIAIRTARHDIEAASQQRREAFTKYFPNVSATGLWFNANKGTAEKTLNPSEMISPEMGAGLAQMLPAEALTAMANPVSISLMKHGTIAGITAMQPIFAGGQIVNGNRLARVGEEAARLQLQLSENDVEKQTEQYYWQLVSLKEKQRTLDAARLTVDTIRRDVALAVEAGLILKNDLLQVDLRRNELESRQLQLDNGKDILRLMLEQHCGINAIDDVEMPRPDEPEDVLPYPVGAGLGQLPEYRLLEKQVEAADLQRKMEIGKNLPTVAVGAGYNYHNLLDRNRSFGMIFATVSIPISGWWGGSHALRRRNLALQQAREELEDNARLLEIRRRKAWNDVQEARAQMHLAEGSIAQTAENLRVQRDCYQAGTIAISDLLQAQLMHQQALDRLTDARSQLRLRMLEYRHSGGRE